MFKEVMLGAAGVALIAAIVAAIKNFLSKKDDEKIESIYVDELNGSEVKKWFTDKIVKEERKGVLLYPTPENIDKWKLDIEESQLDNTLIQAVYDEQKDEIVDFRMIIFNTLSPKLKEMLDASGGALIIEK